MKASRSPRLLGKTAVTVMSSSRFSTTRRLWSASEKRWFCVVSHWTRLEVTTTLTITTMNRTISEWMKRLADWRECGLVAKEMMWRALTISHSSPAAMAMPRGMWTHIFESVSRPRYFVARATAKLKMPKMPTMFTHMVEDPSQYVFALRTLRVRYRPNAATVT